MLDVGGLWWADAHADPAQIVREAQAAGVRALEIQSSNVGLVRELPDLEFLHAIDVEDPPPIHELKHLRGLHISGTWDGRIDFGRLPRLESFGVVECPRDEGGLETLYAGHPTLRELAISRYRHADLAPLGRLPLTRLSLGYARKLTSLNGIGALAPTLRRFDLYACPNLPTLEGIQDLAELDSLALGRLREVTTLEFAQGLARLRKLDVMDLERVESLAPLAGHPALAHLAFGHIRDLDLDPLTRIPRLKLILTGRYKWNRDPHSIPGVRYLTDVADGDPDRVEWYALQA